MEYNQQQKLGPGIITISIIHFLGSALNILTSVLFLLFGDEIKKQAETMGSTFELSESQMIPSIVLATLLVIGVILILLKKAIGIYIYFGVVAINALYSLITSGFDLTIISKAFLPVLMGIFISQKKELYGFGRSR